MAKLYIDASVENSRDDMATADGTALTLTGDARILYDNTVPPGDLVNLIQKMVDKMRQELT